MNSYCIIIQIIEIISIIIIINCMQVKLYWVSKSRNQVCRMCWEGFWLLLQVVYFLTFNVHVALSQILSSDELI